MEWAAAELFKLTGEDHYLSDAIGFAYQANVEGWMDMDSMSHYQKYPFMNMGHYRLHTIAPDTVKPDLEAWYRLNIQMRLVYMLYLSC